MRKHILSKPRTTTVIILFAAIYSAVVSMAAASENEVVPIDPAGVETLIKQQDCPVIIIAMAPWCSPCRAELPILQKLYEKYRENGLALIGVSLDISGPAAMQPIVDRMELSFPVYWGGEKVMEAYKISAVPTLLVVKEGKVEKKILGKRSERFLEKEILSLIGTCEKP